MRYVYMGLSRRLLEPQRSLWMGSLSGKPPFLKVPSDEIRIYMGFSGRLLKPQRQESIPDFSKCLYKSSLKLRWHQMGYLCIDLSRSLFKEMVVP